MSSTVTGRTVANVAAGFQKGILMAKDLAAFGTQFAVTALVEYAKVSITEQRETNRLLRILAGEPELPEPLPVKRKIDVTRPARRQWRKDPPTRVADPDFSGFLR